MIENMPVVAVTNVTFDGRRYRPGARFELPAPCAHALTAAGNVRAAEVEHPDDDDSGEVEGAGRVTTAPPALAASPPAAPPEETPQEGVGGQSVAEPPAPDTPPRVDETRPGRPWKIEDVLGIGPSTAKRLLDAGVADVAALAGLSDEQLEELRVRASWREQARLMASDNAHALADDRPAAT